MHNSELCGLTIYGIITHFHLWACLLVMCPVQASALCGFLIITALTISLPSLSLPIPYGILI